MDKIYYNISNPGGYSSVSKLSSASKKKNKKVKEWLSSQATYTLHKPVRKKFKTYSVYTEGMNDLFQADLVDMQKFRGENDGYKYILTIIDCFTKYACAIPIKTKNSRDVKEALKTAFEEMYSEKSSNRFREGVCECSRSEISERRRY